MQRELITSAVLLLSLVVSGLGQRPASSPSTARVSPSSQRVPADFHIVNTEEVKNPAVAQSPMLTVLQRQNKVAPGQTLSSSGPAQSSTASVSATRAPSDRTAATSQRSPSRLEQSGPCVSQNGLPGAILAVNGQQVAPIPFAGGVEGGSLVIGTFTSNVVFTPDAQYNHYVITGCGFGTQPGKVYLKGAFPAHGGKIELLPYHALGTPLIRGWGSHWTDGEIEAEVDPNVTGELDEGNLALIIETPTGAKAAEGFGVAFYAMRGSPFLVSRIPSSAFCATQSSSPVSCANPGYVDQGGTLLSPCGQWGLSDCTVEVLRPGIQPLQILQGGSHYDQYTLNLKPGFVVYSALQQVAVLNSNGPNNASIAKTYKAEIKGNQIIVQQPAFSDPQTSFVLSLYGLRILVVGPAGVTEAWAGPDVRLEEPSRRVAPAH